MAASDLPAKGQELRPSLLSRLERRAAERPDDSAAWRLLGRAREQAGDLGGAREAFVRAVQLDPLSAAAHFDLARVNQQSGDEQEAVRHFAETIRLAPGSTYAQQAREFLKVLPDPESEIRRAGYEIRRFDRTDLVPGLRPPGERLNRPRRNAEDLPSPLSLRLEAGVLFNTNVALAPTSRDLAPGTRKSFQALLAPEVEYAVWNRPDGRAGPTFQGNFTANEDDFRSLNLQRYQPGVFFERLLITDAAVFLPRIAYDYTHDAFDGRTFADRHAIALSSGVVWSILHESNVYWVTDFTQYADQGQDPDLTSQDGWTNTLGASHRLYFESRWIESVAAGIQAQRADTRGANFTYNGVGLFADAEIPLLPRLWLLVNGGLTHRSYPESQLDPSRDEWIWHAGTRLRLNVTPLWSIAAVASHDRFDSQNELFSTERTIVGLTTLFQY